MKKKIVQARIFIVEDDPMYLRMIKYVMELNPDHEVHVFSTGKECLQQLHLEPTIVTLDYSLPDMTGNEVLKKIKAHNKDIAVVILSSQQDVSTAVKLLRDGAYDYITKDSETKERLLNLIDHIKSQTALKTEIAELKEELIQSNSLQNNSIGKNIIGTSRKMQDIYRMVEKAAKTNITVSVTGETGTGKEVIARSIHFNSTRKKGPFVAVNMSAIPKELLESELFGHEKGAFTGASTRKKGRFELADNGSLFLDEIAEMDIQLQAKVLRAIQEREIMRVGGENPIAFNARIIIATHRDLGKEVAEGRFREDLYYRLLGLPIELPALRERDNDIILLANFFLEAFCKQNKLEGIQLSRKAKDKLLEYNYPGNVRELKAIVDLAVVMCNGTEILPDDIRFNSISKSTSFLSKEMTFEEYKKEIIFYFLKKYNDDIVKVAEKLDIGKSTIYRLLKNEKENNYSLID